MKWEKILEPWQNWSGDYVNTDAFIETLHNWLTGAKASFSGTTRVCASATKVTQRCAQTVVMT